MSGFNNAMALGSLLVWTATATTVGVLAGSSIVFMYDSDREKLIKLKLKKWLEVNDEPRPLETKPIVVLTPKEKKHVDSAYARLADEMVHVASLGECAIRDNRKVYCVRRLPGQSAQTLKYSFSNHAIADNFVTDIRTRRKFLGIEGIDVPKQHAK